MASQSCGRDQRPPPGTARERRYQGAGDVRPGPQRQPRKRRNSPRVATASTRRRSVRHDIRYWAGPVDGWTDDPWRAAALPFNLESHYTSVSAAWIPQAQRWIVIYSEAINAGNDFEKYRRPFVARLSEDLVTWSDRTVIFHPASAYGPGGFMHWPGSGDIIQSHIPPLPLFEPGSTTVRQDTPGWPYGAFLLNRFTEFNEHARVLTIRYLLSTSRPYQVQMMETRLQV
jgi:hypothetical protein